MLNEKWSRPTRVKKSAKSRVNFIFPKVFSCGSEMKMDIEDFKEKKNRKPAKFSWILVHFMMNDLYNLIALKANEKFVHFSLYCHAVQKGKEKPGIMVHKLLYNDNIHRQHYCRGPILFHHCIIIVHIWKFLAFIHCFPISNLTSRYSIRIYLMYWQWCFGGCGFVDFEFSITLIWPCPSNEASHTLNENY